MKNKTDEISTLNFKVGDHVEHVANGLYKGVSGIIVKIFKADGRDIDFVKIKADDGFQMDGKRFESNTEHIKLVVTGASNEPRNF